MKRTHKTLAGLLAFVMMFSMLPFAQLTVRAGNPEWKIECENATPHKDSGTWQISEVRSTSDADCSGKKFYFVQGLAGQKWIEFTLPVAQDGEYDIYIKTKDNADRGIFQFSLHNGTEDVGAPVDFYMAGTARYREHRIGTAQLHMGSVTVRATLTGQNAAATGKYGMVADYFRLVRVGDIPREPQLIYSEDFEGSDIALQLPEGWQVTEAGDGHLLEGNAEGSLLALAEEVQLPATYTAAATVSMATNVNGVSGGLVFGHTGEDQFYHLRLDQTGRVSSIQLMRWNGAVEKLMETSFSWQAGESYQLCAVVNEGTITCYVDGVAVGEPVAVQDAAPGGTVGLRLYGGLTRFDDVQVWDDVVIPERPPAEGFRFDILNPGFTTSEGWLESALSDSTGTPGMSLYTPDASNWARYTPSGLKPGWYKVSFWNIASSQNPMKMNSTVFANSVSDTLSLKTMLADGWNPIGVFYFAGTDDEYVQFNVITAGGHSRMADILFEVADEPVIEQQIWNNEDAAYSESGTWTAASDGVLGHDGSGVRTAASKSASATWSDYPMDTGNFSIYYWNPADEEERAELLFNITTLNGNWRVTINPTQNRGAWIKLATVAATSGTAVSVSMAPRSDAPAYADAVKLVKTDAPPDPVYVPGQGGSTEVAVLVNQLGYDTGNPKRATIVNVDDGTEFRIINRGTGMVDYRGIVQGGIADFTNFEPGYGAEYAIECEGAVSFAFEIGKNLILRRSVQPALAFMAESRQDVLKGASTGYGWRDSHQFSFELNSLVLQYMANPALYESLPYTIADANKCEYPELRVQKEPDIVWLMKFAAQRYYDWGTNKNIQLHMLIKEQLAYFLYIYPEISQYVDEEMYIRIRDFTIEQWGVYSCNKQWYPVSGSNHNLFNVQKVFGGLKGSQPPGHSILPNLLMHEVAVRDRLDQGLANRFFGAAYDNCEYTINSLDINDPYYAKGQRMSEHILMEGLAYFQEMYADRAPAGLKETIESWALKTVARSDNMWDMRMAASLAAGDGAYRFHGKNQNITKDYWTGAAYALADGQNPAPKNEPGNIAGVQAITYAAARVLDDEALNRRLKEIGVSATDDMFGRNPTARAFFFHFTRDFNGGDLGWWMQHKGGYGALEGVTAVIDANPPEACYPYAPENYNTGYTEGWVAYNTAWNSSMAYAMADVTTLRVEVQRANIGDKVNVELDAPIYLNPAAGTSAFVYLTDVLTGERTRLPLNETAPGSDVYTGSFVVPATAAVKVSYGIGLFETAHEVVVADYSGSRAESIEIIPPQDDMRRGESMQLRAVVLPEEAYSHTVEWFSTNEDVATVNSKGLVTAVSIGETIITARSVAWPDVTATFTLVVKEPGLASVQLLANPSAIAFGERTLLFVSGRLSDGSAADLSNADIVFRAAGGTVAQVSPQGVVTAGTVEETAVFEADVTLDGVTASAQVNVSVGARIVAREQIELEDLSATASTGGSTLGSAAQGSGKVVTFKPGKANTYVEFTLPNMEAGNYRLTVCTKTYPGYGQFVLTVNGVQAGSAIDTYSPNSSGLFQQWQMGTIVLEHDGPHTLRFAVTGKNAASSDYNLALDYIVLEKLQGAGEAPVDLTPLETLLAEAQTLLAGAEAGEGHGQYPPEALAVFQAAVQTALQAVRNLAITAGEVATQAENLALAIQVFRGSLIVLSDENDILRFAILDQDALIENTSILAFLPRGTNAAALAPEITVSEHATVSPASGSVQDFTQPVTYTVTAQDGTEKIYTVTIVVDTSADKDALIGLIEDIEALDPDHYRSSAWAVMQEEGLPPARALRDDENATQAEVDLAWATLLLAKQELNKHQLNKQFLRAGIALAEERILMTESFTSGSIAQVTALLETARGLEADSDALQADVNAAATALYQSILSMVWQADKSALQLLVELARDLLENMYTPASWAPFAEALGAAETVLGDTSIGEGEEALVEATRKTLFDAMGGLLIRANFDALNAAAALAEEILANSEKYAPASLEGLAEESALAKTVQQNANATQAEVDNATDALNEALARVYPKANKAALNTLVANAQIYDLSRYTSTSAQRVREALQAAEMALPDQNIRQDAVDTLRSALEQALRELDLLPTPDPIPAPGEDTSPTDQTPAPRPGGTVHPPAYTGPAATPDDGQETPTPGDTGNEEIPPAPSGETPDPAAPGQTLPNDAVPAAGQDAPSRALHPAVTWALGILLLLVLCAFALYVWHNRRKKKQEE